MMRSSAVCFRVVLAFAIAVPFAPVSQLFAAPPTPAHWSVQHLPSRPVAPGAAFTVTLAAAVQPGWHLYALEEPEGGPLATEIGLQQGDPLTLLDVSEPDPARVPDPVTHSVAGVFLSDVNFTLKLRAPRTRPAADAVSHVLVRYQTCNDQVCLPPRTETVALPLKGLIR
ncbi:protein-disulfide reductase DsbD N-terminal domain-containing protein [Terriglobus aquaticus]|uniref:Protein-disulfide reductase DsbD N-terminal domain-containing protein n=1 Tax=Terriglobus aquaticus TaxID=940139 RepID=A0ABW9KHY3_9BACT|nr:protein-disulfide reductase DsbD N-terminal domain-containing protein [Terriglobus aquaticus]